MRIRSEDSTRFVQHSIRRAHLQVALLCTVLRRGVLDGVERLQASLLTGLDQGHGHSSNESKAVASAVFLQFSSEIPRAVSQGRDLNPRSLDYKSSA